MGKIEYKKIDYAISKDLKKSDQFLCWIEVRNVCGVSWKPRLCQRPDMTKVLGSGELLTAILLPFDPRVTVSEGRALEHK